MVLAFFGRDLQEQEIADLLGSNQRGTLFRDIAKVSSLGFDVSVSAGTRAGLTEICATGIPVVVAVNSLHLPTHGQGGPHSVVVAGMTRRTVAVYDPEVS